MKQPKTNPDLLTFQADLKRKFRYLGSFFSIVLIIAGLYLLLNGLLALVSSKNANLQISEDEIFDTLSGIEQVAENEIPMCPTPEEKISQTTNDGKPSISVEGLSTVRASGSAELKAEYTARAIEKTGKWQATDYQAGEIVTGNYTVKLGDTLWEIAEAVYGSGFKWQEILLANQNIIEFLPNGQQALIYPGQVLTIL